MIAGIDTVGGVRVPAGYCGVLGFKSSHGAISNTGIIPVSSSLDSVGMNTYTHVSIKPLWSNMNYLLGCDCYVLILQDDFGQMTIYI